MSKQVKILIVDDNQINRQYFSMTLKKSYALIDVAENGQSAIQKASKNNYDLILMDIRMPKMDGYETTINIRSLENHHKTIIIATSAERICGQHKDLFNDFIPKPIRPKQLLNIVDKYVNNSDKQSVIFNRIAALKYAYEDKEILNTIVAMFVQELPIQLNQLDHSLSNDDSEISLEILHKLKGSCQTCGAENLAQESDKLSNCIKNNANYESIKTTDIHNAAQEYIQLFEDTA